MTTRILSRSRPAAIRGTIAAGSLAVGITTKSLIQDTRADSRASPPKVFDGGPAFVSLLLESADMVNHDTRLLRFKFADKEAVSGLPVNCEGQNRPPLLKHECVASANDKHGVNTGPVVARGKIFPSRKAVYPHQFNRYVPRCTTPTARGLPRLTRASQDEQGHLDLMVKHYPDGRSSTRLHNLQPGQSLFFVASIKGHQWKPNSFPHVTLVAGGAGITPIYQLTQAVLRNPQDKFAVTLVFGVNSDRDVLLKKEFEEWEKKFKDRHTRRAM
ncbi:hypothetical protein MAC_01769 [Metarhizium acridum CQMa 102]|uniref:NADH-cytochrome b5 reductase n=1 Tax=Metarhizium acridum (strain CQMa 102) TaxID=655827 RepID=E9DVX1_METAQ|nr:uncharacterized protein MAC_01769 [Metarhizium acridum CQMa 102]EFY92168.1 hypothetical protein MAC_01769 [Metarhizium acridum CQMa 102]